LNHYPENIINWWWPSYAWQHSW